MMIDVTSTSLLRRLGVLIYVLSCFTGKFWSVQASADQKNVLLIIVDDLRPEIGVYTKDNDTNEALFAGIKTPYIDALAEDSIRFKKAFAQYTSCGPSRASFLTGRRPDTTNVFNNNKDFRNTGGANFTTLPQYFKENGYDTYGAGKIFHTGHNDNEYSWTEDCFEEGPSAYWYQTIFNEESWGAADDVETETRWLGDQSILNYSLGILDAVDENDEDYKFFLAVGFRKPHLPFICPQSFFDLYNTDYISLPTYPYVPDDMPDVEWSSWSDLAHYSDIQALDNSYNNTTPDNKTIELKHAYYACTSYIDDMVGQLLEKLKNKSLDDNTVVMFVSDHGFHLGEQSQWGKSTLLGLDIHVPMLLKVPGITDDGQTWETDEFVELVDVFPTLVDAAGLDAISQCPDNSADVDTCHEGLSAWRFVNETGKLGKKNVRSQFKRGNKMGYSIRDDEYHYIRYMPYRSGSTEWDASKNYYEELYDLSLDPYETVNRADNATYGYADVMEDLFTKMKAGYTDSLPDVI